MVPGVKGWGKQMKVVKGYKMNKFWDLMYSTCAVLSHFGRVRLCDPMDCSPLGSSVHGIFQARILEWVAISFSRGFSCPGINPHLLYLLHWQADSLPLVPPGKSMYSMVTKSKHCITHFKVLTPYTKW